MMTERTGYKDVTVKKEPSADCCRVLLSISAGPASHRGLVPHVPGHEQWGESKQDLIHPAQNHPRMSEDRLATPKSANRFREQRKLRKNLHVPVVRHPHVPLVRPQRPTLLIRPWSLAV